MLRLILLARVLKGIVVFFQTDRLRKESLLEDVYNIYRRGICEIMGTLIREREKMLF